jgi:oligopeptide transport system substrate-binding protein
MASMRHVIRAVVVSALAGMLAACSTAGAYFGDSSIPATDVIIIGNAQDPRSLDPHATAGVPEANIMLNLYDGLTGYDPKTAEPEPQLATSWEHNTDSSVWTFHLRAGAQWTDGVPITAEDFVFSWRRAADPAQACPYANLLYYVKNGEAIAEGKEPDITKLGVRAIDPATFEVTLERPTAFFIAMTPHYVFAAVPRHAIEKHPGTEWLRPENHVSSGPFRLVERVPYDRIVLEKWEGHWDSARVKLRRAIFLPVDDQNTVVNLYKANELQITAGGGQAIPTTFIKALWNKKDFHVEAEYGTYYYSLNVKRPPLDNPLVRHALNMAIDKQALCEKVMQAGQQPATNFVPPNTPGYSYPKAPEYDPEGARKLLAQAGYPGGKGFPTMQIYFNTLETHRQLAEAIQNMWKRELGIPVDLANQEWQVFQATREGRRFDVARDGWIADYLDPNTFLDLFQSDTLNNHPGWVDAKYKKLLESANREPDPARRMQLLSECETILLDQMPVIPIYYYASVKLQKPYIDGWFDNPLDQHQLKYVSINPNWVPEDQLARR